MDKLLTGRAHMNLSLSSEIRDTMQRVIKHIETANALTHNDVTWERKQAVITQGLQLLSDCLDTAVEAVNVVEVMELAKKAQCIASLAMSTRS